MIYLDPEDEDEDDDDDGSPSETNVWNEPAYDDEDVNVDDNSDAGCGW